MIAGTVTRNIRHLVHYKCMLGIINYEGKAINLQNEHWKAFVSVSGNKVIILSVSNGGTLEAVRVAGC